MKRITSMFLLFTGVAILAASCKSDESNNNDMIALLALASLNTTPTDPTTPSATLLSPEQYTTTAAASSASSAASSAVSSAGATALNDTINGQSQKLLASILENGLDPVYIRESIGTTRSAKPAAELAAMTIGSTTGTPGNYTYTMYGDIDGQSYIEQTLDVGPYLGLGSCPVFMGYIPNGLQGKANFGSAGSPITLTFAGTGTSTSYTGTQTMQGDINFVNFGTYVVDMYTMMKNSKDTPPAIPTDCAGWQSLYDTYMREVMYTTTLDGDITLDQTMTYSSEPTTTTNSYNMDLSSHIITSNLVLDGGSPNTMDVIYTYQSALSGDPTTGSMTGSMTIGFNGTVNGTTINDTLSVTF